MHLFYSANLSLWGLDARGFRAAQLVLAIAAALSYHALLRRFARPALALLGALALVASLPFFYVSSSLMTNHYVAGLAFACAALLAYARELERRRWGASIASAALYALAALSKEVYLPAIAVFALMAGRDRDAWRRLVPHGLVIVAVLAWRHAVLGSVVGGYREGTFVGVDEAGVLARGVAALPTTMFGAGAWAAAVGAALAALAAGAGHLARSLAAAALLGAAVLVALLPLIPLGLVAAPDRYLLVATAVLAGGATVLAERFARRRSVLAAALLLGVPAAASVRAHVVDAPPVARAFAAQSGAYRGVLDAGTPLLVVLPPQWPADPAYWSDMFTRLRAAPLAAQPDAARSRAVIAFFGDADPALASLAAAGAPVARFDTACDCLRSGRGAAPAGGAPASPAPGAPSRFSSPATVRTGADPSIVARDERIGRGHGGVDAVATDSEDRSLRVMRGRIDPALEADRLTVLLGARAGARAGDGAGVRGGGRCGSAGGGDPDHGGRASDCGRRGPSATDLAPAPAAFELRLRFPDAASAAAAVACVTVPSIGPAPRVLLRGQPAACDAYVSGAPRDPREPAQ
ncbi:MAG: glycosyltransferase family 39 protein [Burkholderiaceae bacterium]